MSAKIVVVIVLLLAPIRALGQIVLTQPALTQPALTQPVPNKPVLTQTGTTPAAGLCRAAIALAERATGVPDRLLQAIGLMESGRRDASGIAAAWPWTINVEGAGEVFETKAAAIAAVQAHQARGARSIDVGCMQVNLMHHPDAFASLDEAFDPPANARYAARFLQQLLATTGSWPRAVGSYHSMTAEIGAEYSRKVLAIWARPEGLPAAAPAPGVPSQLAGAASGGVTPSLPSGAPAHMVPAAGAGPGFTGRGLDSYRSMPARPGWSSPFKRF